MKNTSKLFKMLPGWVLVFLLVLTLVGEAGAQLQSWDKQINGPGRFTVLGQFNNEAVLDRETGLV